MLTDEEILQKFDDYGDALIALQAELKAHRKMYLVMIGAMLEATAKQPGHEDAPVRGQLSDLYDQLEQQIREEDRRS